MKDKKKLALLLLSVIGVITLFITIGLTKSNMHYFLGRRVPKVLAMALTGGAIAFSSVVFQTITHNRILTPNVLGLDSLYVFIQTAIAFFIGSGTGLAAGTLGNFGLTLMMMVAMSLLLYKVMFQKEKSNMLYLVLVGMVMGTFFSSLSDGMQFLMDPNEFLNLQDTMFASFNRMNTSILMPAIVGIGGALWYIRKEFRLLDAVALGREQAMNLGVDYDQVVKKFLIVVAIMVSVSTALVGPITFLGILVANVGRQLMKSYKHLTIVSASVLIAILSLVGGQLIIERVLGLDVTLSMIINLVGGSYFLYLLLKESRL
ncbi:MAG: iron chelate uptake ABC transporter family permease subunit [Cellulosilyticaceae bacterium]